MKATFYNIYQVHKCTANDDILEALNFVHFMDGYAYASNGHVLVRVALTEMIKDCTSEMIGMINNHSIKGNVFARVIRHKEVEITEHGFGYANDIDNTEILYKWYEIGEDRRIKGFYKYPQDPQPRIPDFESVFPVGKDILIPISAVGINVKNLCDLSQAMGGVNDRNTETLDLYFTGERHGIVCKKSMGHDGYTEDVVGLIMPCIIDEFYFNPKTTKQNENL